MHAGLYFFLLNFLNWGIDISVEWHGYHLEVFPWTITSSRPELNRMPLLWDYPPPSLSYLHNIRGNPIVFHKFMNMIAWIFDTVRWGVCFHYWQLILIFSVAVKKLYLKDCTCNGRYLPNWVPAIGLVLFFERAIRWPEDYLIVSWSTADIELELGAASIDVVVRCVIDWGTEDGDHDIAVANSWKTCPTYWLNLLWYP